MKHLLLAERNLLVTRLAKVNERARMRCVYSAFHSRDHRRCAHLFLRWSGRRNRLCGIDGTCGVRSCGHQTVCLGAEHSRVIHWMHQVLQGRISNVAHLLSFRHSWPSILRCGRCASSACRGLSAGSWHAATCRWSANAAPLIEPRPTGPTASALCPGPVSWWSAWRNLGNNRRRWWHIPGPIGFDNGVGRISPSCGHFRSLQSREFWRCIGGRVGHDADDAVSTAFLADRRGSGWRNRFMAWSVLLLAWNIAQDPRPLAISRSAQTDRGRHRLAGKFPHCRYMIATSTTPEKKL